MNVFAAILAFLSAVQNAATGLPQVIEIVEGLWNSASDAFKAQSPIEQTAKLTQAVAATSVQKGLNLDPHTVAVAVANKVAASQPAKTTTAPAALGSPTTTPAL